MDTEAVLAKAKALTASGADALSSLAGLPAATCRGAASGWEPNIEGLRMTSDSIDGIPDAVTPASADTQGEKYTSESGGATWVGAELEANDLRAAYIELAIRKRLLAESHERALRTKEGGPRRRLRPVSFTLRENHGGRNLALPPSTSLAAPVSTLRSALSFLRSSLMAF